MPYYMGDYYMKGTMRRGDPGFFSVLGGIAKTVGGFIPGVGGIISAAGEAISHAGVKKAVAALPEVAGKAGSMVKSAALKHPVLTGAGAAGLAGAAGVVAGHKLTGPGKLLGTAGGGGRRRRRMRATNTKALRRALRRAYAFERIAMKTIHLVHPRKKGRFGGFKRPRRRVA